MRSRILLGLLFGAAGGFAGFLLQEHFVPHDPVLAMTMQDTARLGAMVGGMIGMAVGAVEGAAVSSSRLLARGMIIGFIVGTIGGLFGIYAGGIIYNFALFGKNPNTLGQGNILDFTQQVIARALGWTFLGAFPGLAAGAATLSRKRALHGLAGGLLGGFIGGFIFDLVASVIAQPVQGVASSASGHGGIIEIGGPSRAIGITTIGALTGLFIGLVEEYFKQAWVRVLAGAKEGKDYIISNPVTVLGRDERADVPLFGDPTLAPQHAAIRMENGRHLLLDGGTQLGSVVNGQRVTPQQPQLLRDGDMIQLGQARLLFREKATASKVGRPAVDSPKSAQAPGAVAMPSHLCPFCGAAKDVNGGCLCTVPGTSPSGPPPMPTAGYGGQPPYPAAGMDPMPGFSPSYGDPMGYQPGSAPAGFSSPAATYDSPAGGGYSFGGRGTSLLALDGPYGGQAFPIMAPSVTIGRSPDNGMPMVNDVTVSRHHAHISDENGQHVLYDNGSSNGTFVNNVRISVQALAPGDIIQLGASKFRYE